MIEELGEGEGVKERIREAGEVCAGATVEGGGLRVVLIREGLAKSGRYFTRKAVEDVARLAEGARAFADHPTPSEDRERPVRSIRDVVGFYREAGVELELEPMPGSGAAGEAGGAGRVGAMAVATLRVFEHAGWLRAMAAEVLADEGPARGVIGLSIDAVAVVKEASPAEWETLVGRGNAPPANALRSRGAGARLLVEEIVELRSVDVVTRASAGGEFVGVKESEMEGTELVESGGVERKPAGEEGVNGGNGSFAGIRMTEGARGEQSDGARAATAAPATEAAVRGVTRRESATETAAAAVGAQAGQRAAGAREGEAGEAVPATGAVEAALEEAQRVLAEAREERVRLGCERLLAERLLAAEGMPEPVRAKLRGQLLPTAWLRRTHPDPDAPPCGSTTLDPGRYRTVESYGEAVERAIELEMATLRAVLGERSDGRTEAVGAAGTMGATGVTDGGGRLVRGHGAVRTMVAEAERQWLVAQIGMDRLFGLPDSDEDADVARARSLGVLSGAPRWLGLREAYVALTGDGLISGSVDAERSVVREANEVTSGVLNQALLNSMTKRLVRDYRGQPQDWRKFCTVVPLRDFKSQDRVKLADFSSLSTVAEGATYTNLAWDDSREAYAPAKRGNLVVVTREAILNDDLNSVRRIPQKLARAAGITMNEFIYGLFTSNPAMADATKVFDDGVQASHGNRSTAALSSTSLQGVMTSMLKQTDTAGKRLNLRPRYLLVPPDLYWLALTILNSTLLPGSANNDVNVLKGALEPISVAQLTDPTDFYAICDPVEIESIEVGFVNGREEPELLMQTRPDAGQVFTNDVIAYKVRWEFGGGWLDYRGAHWAQVAG